MQTQTIVDNGHKIYEGEFLISGIYLIWVIEIQPVCLIFNGQFSIFLHSEARFLVIGPCDHFGKDVAISALDFEFMIESW